MPDREYKLVYRTSSNGGEFTLTGDLNWLNAQWNSIIHNQLGVQLV
jgi:hypothetical protein